jgi:antirestriction protein ArdC
MRAERFDIHHHITDQIVGMIEDGLGNFELPWHAPASSMRPTNVTTKKPYRGVNILALWTAAETAGYGSGLWGTYRQWTAAGAQVRKGEKASYIVFYKDAGAGRGATAAIAADAEADDRSKHRWIARASAVFAAEQVEGYELPEPPAANPVIAIAQADAFVHATKAVIVHEGSRAFYRSTTDTIHLPPPHVFSRTETSSATEAYYATLLHELTHWTGHEARCARSLGRRFGEDAYAMEELIAELGAAFLCADLQITGTPRSDHACYLRAWLDVLRADKKAIFTAASKASQAVDFLDGLRIGTSSDVTPLSLKELANQADAPDWQRTPLSEPAGAPC